ncbi:MAG: T9SS type A sorting domain-containing protein [Saprospiraceae bacterium]
MKNISTLLFLFISINIFGQVFYELPNMPMPVANNAVTEATVNGITHVYSFAGIDETKIYTGIHKKAFRYNTQSQVWDEIAELPSGNGRIAAGASVVKNKIYIIGGYEVFSNGSEVSVNKTHIYNPETNSYEADGTPIPLAIDDHVQAVWKDSLIYVVTGWSNNTNYPNVQIYNPLDDEWMTGTPVPNTNDYKAFGASGAIVGDTIYYLGGAKSSSGFNISSSLRRGIIDSNDPTNITWSLVPNVSGKVYRAAAIPFLNSIYWIGGSEVTYNFNGIAYNDSGGVPPRENLTILFTENDSLIEVAPDMFGNGMPQVMDLRGIASLNDGGRAIIAGGIVANQQVTDKVFEVDVWTALVANQNINLNPFKISPNPTADFFILEKEGNFDLQIWDISGKLFLEKNSNGFDEINISNLNSGVYFVKIFEKRKWIGIEKLVVD